MKRSGCLALNFYSSLDMCGRCVRKDTIKDSGSVWHEKNGDMEYLFGVSAYGA